MSILYYFAIFVKNKQLEIFRVLSVYLHQQVAIVCYGLYWSLPRDFEKKINEQGHFQGKFVVVVKQVWWEFHYNLF